MNHNSGRVFRARFNNAIPSDCCRYLRDAVQAEQGGGVQQLPAVGVGRLRGGVRVQHAPVRPQEAVRHGRRAVRRLRRLHNRRDPAQHQSEAAQAAGRRPQVGAAAGRRGRQRDGRREGRHRRRNHRDTFMKNTGKDGKRG